MVDGHLNSLGKNIKHQTSSAMNSLAMLQVGGCHSFPYTDHSSTSSECCRQPVALLNKNKLCMFLLSFPLAVTTLFCLVTTWLQNPVDCLPTGQLLYFLSSGPRLLTASPPSATMHSRV